MRGGLIANKNAEGKAFCVITITQRSFSQQIPSLPVPRNALGSQTCITIVDVVSVFPDVNGQQRFRVSSQRSARVRGRHDSQFAIAVFHQPVQPEPKFLIAASVNCALKSAKLPKEAAMASASLPVGSPPAFGARQFQ